MLIEDPLLYSKNMVNQSLVNLLESVLGKGKDTANNNHAFICPFCISERKRLGKSKKAKLEIQISTNIKGENRWHCWFCQVKGKTISSLFKKLKAPQPKLDELKRIIKPSKTEDRVYETISLPKEYIPVLEGSGIPQKQVLSYLESRRVNRFDILRYKIGYCSEGKYQNRIIIPSYDENGDLNYFIARSYLPTTQNYNNPKISRDIIFNEFFINWNIPIIICEGVFDALAIKRNVIPLLGKDITEGLMKKIVTSQVKKIYISLDSDAMKSALKFAEQLMNKGKEVYLVEINKKDPSQLGFEKFTEIIQKTEPLTLSKLINKKLELC